MNLKNVKEELIKRLEALKKLLSSKLEALRSRDLKAQAVNALKSFTKKDWKAAFAAAFAKCSDMIRHLPQQIRQNKARVTARKKYIQEYDADKGSAKKSRAEALHELLSTKKIRRLIIADGALALLLVVSLMPHSGTEAASTAVNLEVKPAAATTTAAATIEQPFAMDTFDLTAESDNFGTVELNWEEVPGAPGYVVYRYSNADQTYEPITTITDSTVTSYTDTDVTEGETATYQVTPLFSFEEKKNSNVAAVDVETEAPELSIEVDGQDVQMNWTAVEGSDQYTVLRALEEDGEYAEVAYVNEPEFLDEEMTPGRTYYYKVFAEKGDKVTETSNIESTGEIEESAGTYNGEGLQWPVPSGGHISSGFGGRYSPTWGASSNHQGIDISCGYGCDITAAAGGVVTEVSYSGARGNYVVVTHDDTLSTLYQHLSATNAYVGQPVKAGDTIGYAGSTGISTGTHLHFEVHVYGTPVDPMGYL